MENIKIKFNGNKIISIPARKIKLPEYKEFDFWVHKYVTTDIDKNYCLSDKYFTITDKLTGYKLTSGKTQKEAIADVLSLIETQGKERVLECINNADKIGDKEVEHTIQHTPKPKKDDGCQKVKVNMLYPECQKTNELNLKYVDMFKLFGFKGFISPYTYYYDSSKSKFRRKKIDAYGKGTGSWKAYLMVNDKDCIYLFTSWADMESISGKLEHARKMGKEAVHNFINQSIEKTFENEAVK
jgi:hypothetical protein